MNQWPDFNSVLFAACQIGFFDAGGRCWRASLCTFVSAAFIHSLLWYQEFTFLCVWPCTIIAFVCICHDGDIRKPPMSETARRCQPLDASCQHGAGACVWWLVYTTCLSAIISQPLLRIDDHNRSLPGFPLLYVWFGNQSGKCGDCQSHGKHRMIISQWCRRAQSCMNRPLILTLRL